MSLNPDTKELSDEESELRALPSGVIRSRKGWAGEEMELNHALLSSKQNKIDSNQSINLKDSFQNNEVGKGFQYKSVVRQKVVGEGDSMWNGGDSREKRIDMTGGIKNCKNKKIKVNGSYKNERQEEQQFKQNSLQENFMSNSELRKFKKEITRIIRS